MLHPREITHACPLPGRQVTSCCGQTPFDLPRWDRMTKDAALVTCGVQPRAPHCGCCECTCGDCVPPGQQAA